MRFVDQGWRQVDLIRAPPKPRVRQDQSGTLPSFSATSGPSLHAFTPRVRVLVQCARIKQKMKLSELSEMIRMPRKNLQEIEEGISFPSNKTLELLQIILNVQLIPDNLKMEEAD